MANADGSAIDVPVVTEGKRAPRDVRLDAIRGIAITLIIVQHLGWAWLRYEPSAGVSPAFVGTWSDAAGLGTLWYWALALSAPFCVTIFAFVSGYLLMGSSVRRFLPFAWSRFLTLMVPFLSWVVIYWLDPQTQLFFVNKGGFLRFLGAAIRNPTGSVTGPVWFLPALFISSVVVFAVKRIRPATVSLIVCAVVAMGVPMMLAKAGVAGSLFGVVEASQLVPFAVAGALVRGRGMLRWRADWRRLVAAVATYAACWFLRPVIDAPFGELPFPWTAPVQVLRHEIPVLMLGLAGIWMCFELVALLPKPALGPTAWLGIRSLGICGAQLPAIALLVSLGIRSPWIVFPATLALSAAVSWALDTNRVTRALFLGGRFSAPSRAAGTDAETVSG